MYCYCTIIVLLLCIAIVYCYLQVLVDVGLGDDVEEEVEDVLLRGHQGGMDQGRTVFMMLMAMSPRCSPYSYLRLLSTYETKNEGNLQSAPFVDFVRVEPCSVGHL